MRKYQSWSPLQTCFQSIRSESRIKLHMMHPYQETTKYSASTDEIMSCTLHYELEVMLLCEVDSRLNVSLRSSIDTNRWYASLSTRNSQGSVQVACWYSIVAEYEYLEIGVLHRSWLFWTPVILRVVVDHNWTVRVGRRCGLEITYRCREYGV